MPPQPTAKAPEPRKKKSNSKTPDDPFNHALNAANKRWGNFCHGNRHNWINAANFVLKQYGIDDSGRWDFVFTETGLTENDINTNCIEKPSKF